MKRLDVLLTIDTEIWPAVPGWPENPLPPDRRDLAAEVARYIDGTTKNGNVGIGYQAEILMRHGLTGTFFLEPFFSYVAGTHVLERMVRGLAASGQDVGLHIHTEWLGEIEQAGLPSTFRQFIHQFSADEQNAIVVNALARLKEAGVAGVTAFRAGSYGADRTTLQCLANNGFRLDTSYNACYEASFPDLDKSVPLLDPVKMENVWEVPVSFIEDRPNHRRHAQLNALSFSEMRRALLQAWEHDWGAFVIVWHSSEFIKRDGKINAVPVPERLLLRRFNKLCEFLGSEKEKFRVVGCSEFDPSELVPPPSRRPIKSPYVLTGLRMLEQLLGRIV